MSIFKAPRGVLKEMESIRNKFFIGADSTDKKITRVAWDKVLASKKNGGLGVSSFFALNWALLLKWVLKMALYGSVLCKRYMGLRSKLIRSIWRQIGDGTNSSFWMDIWKGDSTLRDAFPRMFALELDKQISVDEKMAGHVANSFRRLVRGGIEQQQIMDLISYIDSVSLSSSKDRWVCNISGDGKFSVKDIRNAIDDLFLPSWTEPTRWVKSILIKINIFAWRARRDCLPTRVNLIRRGRSEKYLSVVGLRLATLVFFLRVEFVVFISKALL
nr:RNA-directed DNA polymerase, eukaryota [Tanacetum cinerariifolium]